MKKLILNLTLIAFLATALGAYAAPVTNAQIKALIRKYKAKDYVGCVQDSQTLLKKTRLTLRFSIIKDFRFISWVEPIKLQ